MNNDAWIVKIYHQIIQQQNDYVLVSMNIKDFKYLNLKYGREQGDEIVALIYQTMEPLLLADEHIAYVGADDFVLLLHSDLQSTVEDHTEEYAQQLILKFVDAIFDIPDTRIFENIYTSFGVYPIGYSTHTFYESLERANFFRKNEKSIAQRTFTINAYYDEAFEQLLHKHELRQSTAHALKNGEYQVYVQPKVDTKTEKIVGGEALLRRFDASGNCIPLYEFLPILNETGYIRKVDWFVFETVCARIRTQISEGHPIVPISFNISKNFFYDVFMCDNYIESYKKYDIPQKYIEFELMETISLDDTNRMVEVIDQFRNAGFTCSLDDFGNGYSSFCVLLGADLDCIKLDRQFFTKPLDDNSRGVIKGVIDLLKFLNFKIVAEGVETKEYVDYLAELDCDMIQGYYFYKPMPLEDFMQLLKTQTCPSQLQGDSYETN